MPQIHNPKAYRTRSTPVPFETANQNLENFVVDLMELMQKHHIADLSMVAEMCVEVKARDLTEEDSETFVTAVMHIGDQNKAVPMAAYGHAFMRGEMEERLNRLKSSAVKCARGEGKA